MAEFSAAAELEVSVSDASIQSARRQIESGLGGVEVGVSGGGGVDSTTRGQLAGILDANRRQLESLERLSGGEEGGIGAANAVMIEIQRRTLAAQIDSAEQDEVTNQLLEELVDTVQTGGMGGGGGGTTIIPAADPRGLLGRIGGGIGGFAAGAAGEVGGFAGGVGRGINAFQPFGIPSQILGQLEQQGLFEVGPPGGGGGIAPASLADPSLISDPPQLQLPEGFPPELGLGGDLVGNFPPELNLGGDLVGDFPPELMLGGDLVGEFPPQLMLGGDLAGDFPPELGLGGDINQWPPQLDLGGEISEWPPQLDFGDVPSWLEGGEITIERPNWLPELNIGGTLDVNVNENGPTGSFGGAVTQSQIGDAIRQWFDENLDTPPGRQTGFQA